MPSVLLFSGLPLDVRETDLAELLTSEPARLHPASVAVTALHNAAGTFLGTFLVEVGSDADAEKVRRNYSGQIIDGSHSLAVHHVLPQTHPHPSVAPAPATVRPMPKTAPTAPAARAKKVENTKAPGLKLLSRMKSKPGDKDKQKLLIEKQRAAVKKAKGNPGDALLSRLAKSKPSAPTAKKSAGGSNRPGKPAAKATGRDKVARAKKETKMEVDKPAPAAAKPKTQAQLDEEMKAYERARRFAGAA